MLDPQPPDQQDIENRIGANCAGTQEPPNMEAGGREIDVESRMMQRGKIIVCLDLGALACSISHTSPSSRGSVSKINLGFAVLVAANQTWKAWYIDKRSFGRDKVHTCCDGSILCGDVCGYVVNGQDFEGVDVE
jgi:hypothetical protein